MLELFTKLICKDNKLRTLQDIDFVYGIPVRRTGYISINEHVPNPDPFDYLNLVFLFLTLEFSDGMIYSVIKPDLQKLRTLMSFLRINKITVIPLPHGIGTVFQFPVVRK